MIKFAILTVSDGVAAGRRVDLSGDALAGALDARRFALAARAVVADERAAIIARLNEWSAAADIRLILTTGGTGVAPRDVTPQATRAAGDYEVEGFGELMRAKTAAITPLAALSRAGAVVKLQTLIINLPGSPKGATEMLAAVEPLIAHALHIIDGGGHDEGAPNR